MINTDATMALIYDYLTGWALIWYVLGASIIYTVALRCMQLRYFIDAWHYVFAPESTVSSSDKVVHMTSLQAFISTLSANLGNGSIAGMATAIYSGGPGAAFWVLIIGMLLMVIRFAEVFLSIYFTNTASTRTGVGGPMLYLRYVPGGHVLAVIYAAITLLFGLLIGNGVQTNSIRLSLESACQLPKEISAVALLIFVFYIVSGGASRIARVSERLVPLKVVTFFSTTFIILVYHWQSIIPSLKIILEAAFTPYAFAGGIIGFSVQQAMKFGIIRSIFATETGLGTAAILFSSTGSEEPIKDGIMSMLSTFISTIVCFIIALCIIASGVASSGLTSTALTIASYQTVFGTLGSWIVTFLSISFGAGVLVSYAYITREVWFFLSGGRFVFLFNLIYCAVAFGGALARTNEVFQIGDVIVAIMLFINLYGMVCLIPVVRRALAGFEDTREYTNR